MVLVCGHVETTGLWLSREYEAISTTSLESILFPDNFDAKDKYDMMTSHAPNDFI